MNPYGVFQLLLIGLVAVPALSGAAEPVEPLPVSVRLSPGKPIFMNGEPLEFRFTFVNEAKPGGPKLCILDFPMLSAQIRLTREGGAETRAVEPRLSGGIFRLDARIPPGESGDQWIVLNKWLFPPLDSGRYHLEVKRSIFDEQMVVVVECPVAACDFEIGKPDERRMAVELERLATELLASDRLAPSPRERFLSDAICFAEAPASVQWKARILAKFASAHRAEPIDAIEGLSRIGNLECVKTLMDVALSDSATENVKRHAIDAVYKIREQGIAEILEFSAPFVAKFPRPKIGATGD